MGVASPGTLERVARLWHCDPRVLADADLERMARARLPPEELPPIDRMVVPTRRHEALATRVLTRAILARELGSAPRSLRFVVGEHGKPRLDGPAPIPFNVSNTYGMVVCALGETEIGVDVEGLSSASRIDSVTRLVYREEEIAATDSLEGIPRARDLVERWTLKEAYMKARGLGFSLEPRSFSVVTGDRPRLRLVEDGDDPDRWSLSVRWIDDHAIALCSFGAAPSEAEVTAVSLVELMTGG